MKHRFEHAATLMAVMLILALPNIAQAVEKPGVGFVAGLAPYQRPEGAPVIKDFTPDPAWPGYYDLRQWFSGAPQSTAKQGR